MNEKNLSHSQNQKTQVLVLKDKVFLGPRRLLQGVASAPWPSVGVAGEAASPRSEAFEGDN